MSAKVAEVRIGENDFYLRRFGAFQAVEVLGDLQKQFAGPLLGMMDGKQSATPEEANAAMMAAFSKLSATIDGRTLRDLAKRLLDKEYVSVSIEGGQVRKLDDAAIALSLETAADVLQLCWEVAKHNFGEVIARFNTPFTPAGTSLPPSQ